MIIDGIEYSVGDEVEVIGIANTGYIDGKEYSFLGIETIKKATPPIKQYNLGL